MKIVAIGGGENGRAKEDGTFYPYELENIDKEIIRLTNHGQPHFLFIGHAQSLDIQESYYQVMVDIYQKRFGYSCKCLKSSELDNDEYVHAQLDWADIIYVGGGNTQAMISLWIKSGFDKALQQALKQDKVLCGISAGAACWFQECYSDAYKIQYGDHYPYVKLACLGFVDGLFISHCEEGNRLQEVKQLLKMSKQICIALSSCAAIEITDDTYRILTSDPKAYALKLYWKDDRYHKQSLDLSLVYKSLSQLYEKT